MENPDERSESVAWTPNPGPEISGDVVTAWVFSWSKEGVPMPMEREGRYWSAPEGVSPSKFFATNGCIHNHAFPTKEKALDWAAQYVTEKIEYYQQQAKAWIDGRFQLEGQREAHDEDLASYEKLATVVLNFVEAHGTSGEEITFLLCRMLCTLMQKYGCEEEVFVDAVRKQYQLLALEGLGKEKGDAGT